jgi:hypothetical protein
MNMIFRMDRITFYNPVNPAILSKIHPVEPKENNPVNPAILKFCPFLPTVL